MSHKTDTTEERLGGLCSALNSPGRCDHDARVTAREPAGSMIAAGRESESRPNYVVRLEDGSDFYVFAVDELDAVEAAGACAGQDVAHLVREIEGPLDPVAG